MNHQQIKAQLKKRNIYFSSHLPPLNNIYKKIAGPREGKKVPLIVCDKKLIRLPALKLYLKNSLVYAVSAGEDLKNVEHFPQHLKSIIKKIKGQNISVFISIGGGSVGDWTGFLSSVYKRGRPLIHIPTTWLSAMDSAYGGKTALNAGGVKNILGTYCFPKAVFIVKSLLPENPVIQGELLKMSLIAGGDFYKNLVDSYGKAPKNQKQVLWSFLPQAIYTKIQIVEKDPYETKGQRVLLNLGHTMGHALELYFHLPHGEAVRYGLRFAVDWSQQHFKISPVFLQEISCLLPSAKNLQKLLRKMPARTLRRLIEQDKKRQGEKHINFIFIKGPGKVFAKKVLIRELLLFARQQKL